MHLILLLELITSCFVRDAYSNWKKYSNWKNIPAGNTDSKHCNSLQFSQKDKQTGEIMTEHFNLIHRTEPRICILKPAASLINQVAPTRAARVCFTLSTNLGTLRVFKGYSCILVTEPSYSLCSASPVRSLNFYGIVKVSPEPHLTSRNTCHIQDLTPSTTYSDDKRSPQCWGQPASQFSPHQKLPLSFSPNHSFWFLAFAFSLPDLWLSITIRDEQINVCFNRQGLASKLKAFWLGSLTRFKLRPWKFPRPPEISSNNLKAQLISHLETSFQTLLHGIVHFQTPST